MAITFVACTRLENNSGNSVTGSVSGTGGNAMICQVQDFSPGTATLTTSGGGTWTTDHNGSVLNTQRTSSASCPNITGGAVSRTASYGAGVSCNAYFMEFSGMATSSIFEAAGTTASGTTSPMSTGALSNTQASAVKVAMVAVDTGDNQTLGTSGTGWTIPTNGSEGNGAAQYVGAVAYKIVAASQSDTETFTWSGTFASGWTADIRTYLAPAAAQDTPELRGRPFGLRGQTQMHQLLAQERKRKGTTLGKITVLGAENITLTTGVTGLAAFQTAAAGSAAANVFLKRLEISQNGSTTLGMVRGAISTTTHTTVTVTSTTPTNVRPAGGAASGLTGNTAVAGGTARSGTNVSAASGGAYVNLYLFNFSNTSGYLWKPDPEEEIWIPASTICVVRFLADPGALTAWTVSLWLKEE